VVASEIRNLAESTAKNANSIRKTLKDLGDRIHQAEEASQNSLQAFEEIEQGVHSVVNAFSEITSSTKELSAGAREMLDSVNSLSQISLEVQNSATEMRQAAQEVTASQVQAREKTQSTAQGVREISGLTIDLTTSTEDICQLNIASNNQVIESLHVTVENWDPASPEGQAQRRLEIANLIMNHLIWVNQVRGAISGQSATGLDKLMDPGKSQLNHWIKEKSLDVIQDKGARDRLVKLHGDMYALVQHLVKCDEQGLCVDKEEEYQKLLAQSRDLVQILSAYQTDDSVRWSPDLAVQVPLFDKHHKSLLSLIDRLFQALKHDKTQQELLEIFNELLDYTSYHFGAEQAVFDEFQYPDRESHKAQHQQLVSKALELREDLHHGKPMVAVEVMEFLRDWVTNHIKKCDKLYSSFLKDMDVETFLDKRREFWERRGKKI